MTITVKGYQRRINGKLVTIHGYAANRNSLYPSVPSQHAQTHVENVVRPGSTLEAGVGTYIQPSITRGLGGKTAYLYRPGGPTNRDLPEYRWRTTHLPINGAYKIPKSDIADYYANLNNS